ncbi:MAG: winged helix-turn-helix domain-containing protein [Pseudomonadota bacterium]
MLREPFSVSGIHVEPQRNLLLRYGKEIPLEPRIMDVLTTLAASQGEVLTRDQIIEAVWNVDHGGDESLSRAVSILRKAFRDLGIDSSLIETIPKRGYRLVAGIDRDEVDNRSVISPSTNTPTRSSEPPFWRRMPVILAVALILVVVATISTIEGADKRSSTSVIGQQDPVLAVLPFDALSNEAEDAYFARGIAEELLTAFSTVADIGVIARTSSFSVGADEGDPGRIGERLGASHLLAGTVQQAGNSVRVTVSLTETESGLQVWSDTYQDDASDIFAMQNEIVRQIAQSLEIRLGVGRYAGVSTASSVDPVAHEFYLQGLDHFGNRMRVNGAYHAAEQAYRSAVEYDPGFGEAWVGIALVGISGVGGPLARDREAFMAETRIAIDRALELQPDSPTLNSSLVIWHLSQDIDLDKARLHLARAQDAAPRSVITLYAEAAYYSYSGDVEQANSAYKRSLALDPLNLSGQMVYSIFLSQVGRHEEASDFFETCAEANCLQEGFLAFGMTAAILSGDDARMADWQQRYEPFEASWKQAPASSIPRLTQVMPAWVSIALDRPEKDDQISELIAILQDDPITDTFGLWAPALAEYIPEDLFFDLMELAHARGDLIGGNFALSSLYDTNPYPDWVLSHPRYRALWTDPGLASLEAARLSNAWTTSLPTGRADGQ